MKTNDTKTTNFSVYSFLGILDREVKGIKVNSLDVPQVVNVRPFLGRGLKSRLANKVFSIVMRPSRRATRDYWHAQNNVNHQLLQKIALLEDRIQKLESERGER